MMYDEEYAAAVATFTQTRGITRCPTPCALPTQDAADRATLQRYAALRNQSRWQQQVARDHSFWTAKVLAGFGE
jgi:hypothetical protein